MSVMGVVTSVIAVAVSLVLVVWVGGATSPAQHEVESSSRFTVSARELWAVVTDFERYPAWRPSLRQVESVVTSEGDTLWREVSADGGAIPYRTVTLDPERRLVREIADPALPFGGSWEFILEPMGAETHLTIRERGEVRPIAYRFFARFVFGHRRSIEGYLADLHRRLDPAR